MKNAEKFQEIFKEFATEVWAFPEKDFLTWLNAEYEEPTTQERQAESDKFDAAFQDGYDHGYAQARFDYEQEPTTKNNLGVDCIVDILGSYTDLDIPYKREIAENILANLPSVTPQEPKIGHWIEKAEDYYKEINEYGGGVDENTDYFTDDIACPKCLSKFSTIDNETERFRHCPNCGAKMVEPQESEEV